jgi:prevent-host-death family protein
MTTVPAAGASPDRPPWTVASAKAHLSELIERALSDGPQTITRRGQSAVVVVATREWERRTRRAGSLADFLARSPLAGSGLVVERVRDAPREIDL